MKRIMTSAQGSVLAAVLFFLVTGTTVSLLHAFAGMA